MARKHVNRNCPPEQGIRVPAAALGQLVGTLFEGAGTPPEDAGLMAQVLVQNDLRCVFSHGTRQLVRYIPLMLEGRVNPRPEIKVVDESPTTLVLDGDGGMGYLPCYRGTEQALEKARECGTAALTTRNHYHFGAAGTYSRMAVARDCIGLAASSHRFWPAPESPVTGAGSNSPISIAVPAGEQPPLVLDMGNPGCSNLFEQNPALVFKTLGLGAVIQVLGAILPGIYRPEFQEPQSRWDSNQGGFVAVFEVGRFMPVEEFKKEMDRYIGQARAMQPMPGMEEAELPGGLEWQWERENSRDGVQVSPEHQEELEGVAAKMGVETGFGEYEHTRF